MTLEQRVMYFRADGKNLVVVYKEFCFSACFTGRRILATAAFTHNANYAVREHEHLKREAFYAWRFKFA